MAEGDGSAGGADATGNKCNGAQSAPSVSNAAANPSKADTRILFAKRAETQVHIFVAQAKQRQSDANADMETDEASPRARGD